MVLAQNRSRSPLIESPLISSKQGGDRIFPSKLFFDPDSTELTHFSSLFGIVEQPEDLVGKIVDSICCAAV
jgi:hypothetical protein